MARFCDVAVPVPLESTYTYSINGIEPVAGGRVVVPFRAQKHVGIVTRLHDDEPKVTTKPVQQVVDSAPLLSEHLLEFGRWMASYYIAPIGEVYRSMLPLLAEVKKTSFFSIADAGLDALHRSAEQGSSRRSKLTIDEQMTEYHVLDYLANSDEAVREATLRSATGATRQLLAGMVRKSWIRRTDSAQMRDASRVRRVAVLEEGGVPEGKRPLNDNQQILMTAIIAAGGRSAVEELNKFAVPRSTLQTLVRRGLVRVDEEAVDFHVSHLPGKGTADLEFTGQQQAALKHIGDAVNARKFSVTLLHGVTGSGKTAVYLDAMQRVLASGGGAIMLVPEIGLTPAAAAHLHHVFGDAVAILHSALTDPERAEQWHRIHRGEARVVVGTRSAVFAPVADLRLLIVDEEHDHSYKQESAPRYHGRDVAVMRGKLANAAVVLGSATPSLESYHNAKAGKYHLVELRQRVMDRPLPEVEIVDLRHEFQKTGKDNIFSSRLIEEVQQRVEAGEQAIILMNRRGYSSVVVCRSCGEAIQCRNCAITLTHHKGSPRLECHYCGYRERVPKACPKCKSEHIYFLGAGSEQVEERLHQAFPTARIGRLDRDTVRGRYDFERVLNQLNAGEIDILVGTQMVAKGHDIHGVTLVGVVGADFALGFPDFRAAERTFQLLTQVAGRAGRGYIPGKVILQTFFPEHYAIQFAQSHDFDGFAKKELQFRKWMHYPPFSSVANVLVRSDKLEQSLRYAGEIGSWFKNTRLEGIRVMGPAAAPLVRLKRDYRYHFVLKATSRESLNQTLRAMLRETDSLKIPRSNVIVDVDALSLM